jgi:hypothetical protein
VRVFLIELFLPLNRRDGLPIDQAVFDRIKKNLTERFGGVTAFALAPAEGVWKSPTSETVEERVAVFQVMVKEIDVGWWRACRQDLERELDQEEILVRSLYMNKI